MTPASVYVFSDNQQPTELERLTAVQDVFDPVTHRNLEQIGVAPGWHCLEVGAGVGSIMHWLCDRVGPTGHVVAVDRDPRFIQAVQRPNLTIRALDITTTSLEPNAFDLIHLRCVMVHIATPQPAWQNLIQALKPGGWLLIEEPDFSMAALTLPDQRETQVIDGVFAATRQMYSDLGMDNWLGRKLPLLLQQHGLGNIQTHVNSSLMAGGSLRAKIWWMAVEHLRSRLLATGLTTPSDLDQFKTLIQTPTTWALDYALISAWGQKSS